MPDGGFLVKFDGKKALRCYAIAFDHDEGEYTINGKETHAMPSVKKITIEIEEG